jgi:hypothetical protein
MSGRNDIGYVERVNFFLETFAHFFRKYKLSIELIIVEYNYDEEKPSLRQLSLPFKSPLISPSEVVRVPKDLPSGLVRIIRVPKKYHEQLPDHGEIDFSEYVAKNVGIRRSRGRFIACINADSLWLEISKLLD